MTDDAIILRILIRYSFFYHFTGRMNPPQPGAEPCRSDSASAALFPPAGPLESSRSGTARQKEPADFYQRATLCFGIYLVFAKENDRNIVSDYDAKRHSAHENAIVPLLF